MEHSFAASPRMLFPFASTFTWKLVNTPNCEIIRGEVSIFRGGAGGLSYFSSGSVNGSWLVPEGAVCAEAVVRSTANTRAKNRLAVETLECLMWSAVAYEIGLWSF